MGTEQRDEKNLLTLPKNDNNQSTVNCIESSTQSKELLENNSDNYKVDKLKNIIKNNLIGCDFSICIFIAALNSFRVDQCLRPFPQCFINKNNEKDFVGLKKACDRIPPLTDILKLPANKIPKDIVNLLLWLFIESGIPTLTINHLNNLPLSVVNEKASIKTLPHQVFEVNYNLKFEETWKNRIKNREIFYTFHGSVVNNFYSILKFGLQQHFSRGKEVIFGTGIYLSDDISICTNYSPFGESWKNSMLASKHSIIAVCEVINDEIDVKCKDGKNKKRSKNQNSYGEIPEKYFVVTNSELVKVKYLLVYGYKGSSVVKSFIKKNFLWLIVVFYFFMLVLIGLFNGPYWRKFVRFIKNLIN